jgi:hypothetical protein
VSLFFWHLPDTFKLPTEIERKDTQELPFNEMNRTSSFSLYTSVRTRFDRERQTIDQDDTKPRPSRRRKDQISLNLVQIEGILQLFKDNTVSKYLPNADTPIIPKITYVTKLPPENSGKPGEKIDFIL